ncbi:MAG: hypothetical protein GWO38_31765 [Phycisphaerae bacterium]|nr:hypothetical protein [Phycisphaerae bacterium]NIW99667.1 hypothetical protein [Phycisphaerae bacterium]NIX32080.1 hypothetical protein [Phycisphaerae bacterium]
MLLRTFCIVFFCASLIGCVGTDLINDAGTITQARIEIVPGNVAIQTNNIIRFQATYYDSLGQPVPAVLFHWTSGDTSIATIDQTGLALGRNLGQVMIYASTQDLTSEPALLTVVADPNQVSRVVVMPDSARLNVGESLQFMATALNLKGEVVDGKRFHWRSSDTTVARIDTLGVIKAVSPGTVEIIASTEGLNSRPAFLEVMGQSRAGMFTRNPATSYNVAGTATLEQSQDGGLILNFGSDFSCSNGPGLAVFLSGNNRVNSNSLNLGNLKSTSGAQSYEVPETVQLTTYDWVIIHCVPFNVTFGYAQLQ